MTAWSSDAGPPVSWRWRWHHVPVTDEHASWRPSDVRPECRSSSLCAAERGTSWTGSHVERPRRNPHQQPRTTTRHSHHTHCQRRRITPRRIAAAAAAAAAARGQHQHQAVYKYRVRDLSPLSALSARSIDAPIPNTNPIYNPY